jgi:Transmembrane domain of unknown function (DUF3566)
VSRKLQRTGTFGRLTSVIADGGKTSGKQSPHPGDNLDSGEGSEEDGVENRSEPEDWLTDGSPGAAGSGPDVSPAAGVTTVPPLPGAGSSAAGGKSDAAHNSSSASSASASSGAGDQDSWEPRGSANGSSGNGSSSNGGSAALSNGGPSASADRPAPDAGQGPAMVSPAGPATGVAGAPLMSAPYASADSSRGPQATAPFSSPAKSRIRPTRPGKAPRTQQAPSGRRPAPAGFQPQGGPSSRKAQLAIARIEPWSVMKFSFMISLVGWVILFVAVALMYYVLQKIGVFASIERTVGLVTASKNRSGTNASSWFSASRVLGYTMLVGAVNVILITALATIGSVLYNLVTMLAGGIEVTLKETD